MLKIIDAKDHISEDTSLDSFISGFRLAWRLSAELNHYNDERPARCQAAEKPGARFTLKKEDDEPMKKRIVAAVITACLALCAAVWPQPDTREEQPAPIPTHAAAAPKADVVTTAEKKNTETPRAEPDEELGAVPVPAPAEPTPAVETPQPGACASRAAADHRAAAGDEVYIPGLAGYHTRGRITASMPRICTKMATKSGAWVETGYAGSGHTT